MEGWNVHEGVQQVALVFAFLEGFLCDGFCFPQVSELEVEKIESC